MTMKILMTLSCSAATLLSVAACVPRQTTLGDAKTIQHILVDNAFVADTAPPAEPAIASAVTLNSSVARDLLSRPTDVFGPGEAPAEETEGPTLIETGKASYYGPGFHGKKTASGSIYDMHQLVAAHPTLPFGTIVRVTNHKNQRSVNVRIVDRGPVKRIVKQGVIIDLSVGAAQKLGFIRSGRTPVSLDLVKLGKPPAPKTAAYKYALN